VLGEQVDPLAQCSAAPLPEEENYDRDRENEKKKVFHGLLADEYSMDSGFVQREAGRTI
jgi:hypothetical protein